MMRESYKIRLIDKTDISRFVQILKESFKSEQLIPSIYRGSGIEKHILNELNNQFSPYRYFGVYDENRIIGSAEYKITEKDIFFLNLIASDNEFKGQGVGTALFSYAIDFFSNKGFNKIQLDVYESNDLAVKWYKSIGFTLIDVKSIYKMNTVFSNEASSPIYILNYPQYRLLHEYYGFNYLDIMIDSEVIRHGVIDNDLIIRGVYNQHLNLDITFLCKQLKLNNIYFIGDPFIKVSNLTFINNILRMELNLK